MQVKYIIPQGCAPPGRWVYVLIRSRATPATALPPPLQFVGDSISAARELRSNSAVLTEPVAHAQNADAENVNIGIDPNAELIEIDGDDVGTTVEDTNDRYHRIAQEQHSWVRQCGVAAVCECAHRKPNLVPVAISVHHELVALGEIPSRIGLSA